jgi:REP element-mobilizing transposase RayT
MARRLRHFPAGTIVSVTDRCIDEAFLLLPDRPEVAQIIQDAWRDGLRRFPVELLLLVVMSNHWHAELRSATKDQTAIPRFMQYVKSRVAREINELRGRRGIFWAQRYTAIPVIDDASVSARMAYDLHNPVKAGLCATAAEWPGLSTLEASTGLRAACGRVDLPVSLPDAWVGHDRSQLADERRAFREELRARERESAEDRKSRGLSRPKVQRVIASVTWQSRTAEPARSPAPRCFAATAEARKAFRLAEREITSAYRTASESFRAGMLDVMFPAGMFAPRLERPPNEAPI